MRIVLVSPFHAERTALQALLEAVGHRVIAVATRAEGVEIAQQEHPEVVLADAQVIGHDGHALLQELSDRGLHPRVIFLCPRASRAVERRGIVCLTKPIDLAQLHHYLSAERVA